MFDHHGDGANHMSLAVRLAWIRDQVGLIGIYAFSFYAWLGHGLARTGLALIVLASLTDARFWAMARRSVPVQVAGLTAAYIVARTVAAMIMTPELAAAHLAAGGYLLLMCAFVLVGWCMGGRERRILVALMFALAGFTVGRIKNFDLSFDIPWWMQRPQFGLPTATAFGDYAAVAALGLLILAPRLWRSVQGRAWKWLVMPIWFLAVLVFMQGVVLSQTRATWFGLVVLLPVALMLYWRQLISMSLARIVGSFLIFVTATGLFMYMNYDTVSRRIGQDSETYVQLLSGNFEDIEQSNSIGVFFFLHSAGLETWRNNPVFGIGPFHTRVLSGAQVDGLGRSWNDFHNSYIEWLVQVGLVGTVLLLICIGSVFVAGWRAYRERRIHLDVFAFLSLALALFLLANFTSSRMLSKDGLLFWLFFGGALVTTSLAEGGAAQPHRLGDDTGNKSASPV